jgi:hypothetical protein
MKLRMTMEILTIIHYVQTQRTAFATLNVDILKNKKDYIQELREIYNSLPLPDGLNTSNACFEAILLYPLNDKIMNSESIDLPKNFYFGY